MGKINRIETFLIANLLNNNCGSRLVQLLEFMIQPIIRI